MELESIQYLKTYWLRREGIVQLIEAIVCLLAALQVQSFGGAGNG